MEKLEAIAAAMEKTANEAGVKIVAGDTKVAGKGQVDGVFITTTGIGEIQEGVETSDSWQNQEMPLLSAEISEDTAVPFCWQEKTLELMQM